ncbi:hypothetical protein C8Q79DRAFT_781590 [Trametes meyenii]|nr:hypothetical protein C8Q79DRAFT_781590 [Trametes meyenii]
MYTVRFSTFSGPAALLSLNRAHAHTLITAYKRRRSTMLTASGSFPQLPPLPPQTPFVADHYPWERHYPSTSVSSISTQSSSERSHSTSPKTRLLALPFPPLPGVAGPSIMPDVASPPPLSQSRAHSHSRNGSRVLVVPSASSTDLVIVPPPARTHSRSVSAAAPKHSHPPRPTAADPSQSAPAHKRTKSRPLPLPLPPKGHPMPTNQVLVRTESLPMPRPVAVSAPVAPRPIRHHTSPRPDFLAESTPNSAPVRQVDASTLRSRAILATQSSEQLFLATDAPLRAPISAPARAPTPPKPKARQGLPATPRRPGDNRGTERGRSPQMQPVTTVTRGSPGPVAGLEQGSSPRAKPSGTEFARKWVLEKNGKRLTQDSIVVAQQLRMLR